jgi:hypothetical protein
LRRLHSMTSSALNKVPEEWRGPMLLQFAGRAPNQIL